MTSDVATRCRSADGEAVRLRSSARLTFPSRRRSGVGKRAAIHDDRASMNRSAGDRLVPDVPTRRLAHRDRLVCVVTSPAAELTSDLEGRVKEALCSRGKGMQGMDPSRHGPPLLIVTERVVEVPGGR